jgi:hypothetical protein
MSRLMYSELTGKVYFTTKGHQKIEIEEQNFIQMVLLWLHHGLPDNTKSVTRTLKVDETPHYEITCKKLI